MINRYVIIQKLGWGHFSTVWLAKDFKYDTYVAIKIQKSAPHYMDAAYLF
jgi:serine/threonine-protein kinase SRPK3